MNIHDIETFAGNCTKCGVEIMIGKMCAGCANNIQITRRIVIAPHPRETDHGAACGAMCCVKKRAEERSRGR